MDNLIHIITRRETEGVEFYFLSPNLDKSTSMSVLGLGLACQQASDHSDVNLTLIVNQYRKNIIQSYKSLKVVEPNLRSRQEFIEYFNNAVMEQNGFNFQINYVDGLEESANSDQIVMVLYNGFKQLLSIPFQKITMSEAFSTSVVPSVKTMQQEKGHFQDVNRALEQAKNELQSTLKKLIIEKNVMEDSLYRAFTKCLNTKKEKIRQLQQDSKTNSSAGSSKTINAGGKNGRDQDVGVKKFQRGTRKKFSESEGDSGSVFASESTPRGSDFDEEYDADTDIEMTDEDTTGIGATKLHTSTAHVTLSSASSSGAETDFSFDDDSDLANQLKKANTLIENKKARNECSTSASIVQSDVDNNGDSSQQGIRKSKRLNSSTLNTTTNYDSKRAKLNLNCDNSTFKYDKDALLDDL